MLVRRFLWADQNWDETLSWTNSLLFPLVLGTCRESKGEEDITIYMIDADRAVRPAFRDLPANSETAHERPTIFRFGPDLIKDLNLVSFEGINNREREKLCSYWFTHEFISHHEVVTKTGSRSATLPELVAAGRRIARTVSQGLWNPRALAPKGNELPVRPLRVHPQPTLRC